MMGDYEGPARMLFIFLIVVGFIVGAVGTLLFFAVFN